MPQTANNIRQEIIKMLVNAGSGHSAGPLGMADVFTALYFQLLKQDPKNPNWEDRDRLILSCGHICPVLYATLATVGYFPEEELLTFLQINSRMQGHPHFMNNRHPGGSVATDRTPSEIPKNLIGRSYEIPKSSADSRVRDDKVLPGVENTAGPLGQGISQAVGLALGAKMNHQSWRTVCITSDGEQQEGMVWEAYMLAAKYHLGNLTFILDRNNIQIDGYIHDIMPLEPLKAKFQAFGLFVLEIDGHNFEEIADAYHKSLVIHDQPTMIIAHTIPGKDIEFMENLPEWHGKPPTIGDSVEALAELRQLYGQIELD